MNWESYGSRGELLTILYLFSFLLAMKVVLNLKTTKIVETLFTAGAK